MIHSSQKKYVLLILVLAFMCHEMPTLSTPSDDKYDIDRPTIFFDVRMVGKDGKPMKAKASIIEIRQGTVRELTDVRAFGHDYVIVSLDNPRDVRETIVFASAPEKVGIGDRVTVVRYTTDVGKGVMFAQASIEKIK